MARRKKVALVAVLDAGTCTGCQTCMTVCPTQCISTTPGARPDFAPLVCEINTDRCVGCKLCDQVCPWDCIEMVPASERELTKVA